METTKELQLREDDILHREHGVYEELEPAHADTARSPVLVHLDCIEVIAQESADIFKDTILRLQEVDPREKIEDQVALDVVRLLEHV